MFITKAAYILAGAATGAVIVAAAGPASAGNHAHPAHPSKQPAANVALAGARGKYLQFVGSQSRPGTFKGTLVFKQPVITGTYTLYVTLGQPGKKTRLKYDIQARQR